MALNYISAAEAASYIKDGQSHLGDIDPHVEHIRAYIEAFKSILEERAIGYFDRSEMIIPFIPSL